MEHRHINTQAWSAAAIDSILERGDLKDWQELLAAAERNIEVSELILKVVSEHKSGGAALARSLVIRFRPELSQLKFPAVINRKGS